MIWIRIDREAQAGDFVCVSLIQGRASAEPARGLRGCLERGSHCRDAPRGVSWSGDPVWALPGSPAGARSQLDCPLRLETPHGASLQRGGSRNRHFRDTLSECVLSTITVAELEVGVRRSVRPAAQRKAVDAFIEIFEVLPWDLQATSYCGDLRVDLEKRGIIIGPLEMLIAAHALRLGATLVTANIRGFRRVADLQCLECKL